MPGLPGMPPFPGMSDGPKKPGGFNVDDIVKRIDARIAELEAEEKREKEKKQQEKVEVSKENSSKSIEVAEPKVVDMPKKGKDITDDQFFDDFFCDDEF